MTTSYSTATKARLIRAAFLLVGTLMGLLAAECAVRIFLPQDVSAPWVENIYGINTLMPHIRGRFTAPGAYDTTFSVNRQRFRGTREFQPSPSRGVSRIALLGDSLTFGLGANNQQTYPYQLSRILGNWFGPRRFEILNAGIPGVGTGEEAWWFNVWVKRFHPDVVVLNVFWNDVDDDFARSPFVMGKDGRVSVRPIGERSTSRRHQEIRRLAYALPGFSFLAQHSQLFNLLRRMIQIGFWSTATHTPSGKLAGPQIEKTHELYRRTGLLLLSGEIAWLQERIQASGARLVVVFLPGRQDIYPSSGLLAEEIRWKSSAIVGTLTKTCLDDRIPFDNLTSQVRKEALRLPELIYYDAEGDSMHPNPNGYRIIAEAVAAFLKREEIIGKQPRYYARYAQDK